MSRGCARTIGPRIRINRHDGASAKCSGSNRPDQPSASCPFTPPFTTRSTSSVISHPAARFASYETKRSGRGEPPLRPEVQRAFQTPRRADPSWCDSALRSGQRLEPGANFGHVRKRLREFAGLKPSFPIAERAGRGKASDSPITPGYVEPIGRPAACGRVRRPGAISPRKRLLPSAIVEALPRPASCRRARRQRLVRSSQRRGFRRPRRHSRADLQGSLTGGAKSLFRLPRSGQSFPRLVLAEAAIDALSVAAIGVFAPIRSTRQAAGAWGQARSSPRSRRCSQPWRRSQAQSSAAPRTPMDRAIATRNATDRSRKNSACRSHGFDIQSEGGDWKSSFARSQHQGSTS